MIKKIVMSVLFLVSVGLPLQGMNKDKKTICNVEQLKQELARLRKEMPENRKLMYEDMTRKISVDHNSVIKVDVQPADGEKKQS